MSRSNLLRHDFSANHYVPVTRSDVTNFADGIADGLYIGTSGDLVVVRPDGVAVTFTAVPAGTLAVRCVRVNSTGTTADNIVALYR